MLLESEWMALKKETGLLCTGVSDVPLLKFPPQFDFFAPLRLIL